ncbi:mitochondrial carrier protein LEU5 [Xylariomycetidae sp. FL0641]|nr:mitochondrial carrier protein LEU5 [Xylariomycetidae sp. FL0641]
MPSALSSHASISEFPSQREGNAETTVGKMDGAAQNADHLVTRSAAVDTVAEEAKRPGKHSVDYIVRSGIAGGLAGCAAKTAVAPLDRVKILFQTSNPQFAKYTNSWFGLGRAMSDIYAREGLTGLFRGHSATLLKIYPYAAIKFVAYEQYRAVIIDSRSQETWLRRFGAGALAGVTSVFFTYPLEVIRVRLAFETKHTSSSLADICQKIYHEHPLPPANPNPKPKPGPVVAAAESGSAVVRNVAEAAASTVHAVAPRSGLVNFYRGFSTTLLGMVPYAGMSFLTHDTAGDFFRLPYMRGYATLPPPAGAPPDKPAPLRAWAELVAGGVSGAVSQTVAYPLEVVRRRMQVGGAVGDGHRLRIGETTSMVFRERGLRGFFVGLSIGYVKVFPMSAVAFYTYERAKTLLGI